MSQSSCPDSPSLDLSCRTDQTLFFVTHLIRRSRLSAHVSLDGEGPGTCAVCVARAGDVAAARPPQLLDQKFGRGYAPAGTLGFERRLCASAQDFCTSSGKPGSSKLILRCIS